MKICDVCEDKKRIVETYVITIENKDTHECFQKEIHLCNECRPFFVLEPFKKEK